MARIVFSISNLLPPLCRLQELYTVIPQGRTLSVHGSPRIVYFLGDNVELLRADRTVSAIGEGDVLIAPAGIHYRIQARDRKQKVRNHVLVVTFEDEACSDSIGGDGKDGRTDGDFKRIFSQGLCLMPGALNQGGARSFLQLIRREADKNDRPNSLLISGLCTALISGLLEAGAARTSASATPVAKGEAAVEHARQYMRQFCHEKLTLSRIAWEVQLSGEHLARLFRIHNGSTVFEYLNEIRIEKARQFLQTTDLPVVRIAPICGFPSSTLLARHFKARTGQTPLAYRLEVRSHESFRLSEIEDIPGPPRRGK